LNGGGGSGEPTTRDVVHAFRGSGFDLVGSGCAEDQLATAAALRAKRTTARMGEVPEGC
jgi:hypothetical protein